MTLEFPKKEPQNLPVDPARKKYSFFWTATLPGGGGEPRGNYIIYFNQPFFFIAEACHPNSLIVQCLMVVQTMIEYTYSLISSCRLSVHSALIITSMAGSKHESGVLGFQRDEGREIMLSSLAIFLLIFSEQFQKSCKPIIYTR